MSGLAELFLVFLRLGLTSFGGPVAHLGYFRTEFVERRRWLDDSAYADLVALCQFLPGPASSEVGIAIGIGRGGLLGGCLAWLGFTLPSAVLMLGFAAFYQPLAALGDARWLHGLGLVAVAVVAQALLGMARQLCPDRERASIAVAACVAVLAWPGPAGQLAALAGGALAGLALCRVAPSQTSGMPLAQRGGSLVLLALVPILLVLPYLASAGGGHAADLFSRFYRTGALVFGGGHVVLPLLREAVVPPGWVDDRSFLAGYGAAQALPGPLFAFAAFLGAAAGPSPNGIAGGLIALIAIYLAPFLLTAGALPWWQRLRASPLLLRALAGINAAVVGLLLAAFYRPLWTETILGPADFAVALVAFLALVGWKAPPWLVVPAGAVAAFLIPR